MYLLILNRSNIMIISLKNFIKYFNNFSSTSISIILMIISGFSFIVMHSAAKYLSDEVHVFEITFLICVLVIFVLAPLIIKQGLNTFITKQPKLQIYRIITNSIAMLCFFLRTNFNYFISSYGIKFISTNFYNVIGNCFFKRKN